MDEIMSIFTKKLDIFTKSDMSKREASLLCAWAYLIFIVIHPYSDGNGRTGRSIVKFLDHLLQRESGITADNVTSRTFPNRASLEEQNKAVQEMMEAIYQLKLTPAKTDSNSKRLNSYEIFINMYYKGKSSKFFEEAKQLLIVHMSKIDTVYDLHQIDSELSPLFMSMGKHKYIKPGQTKPLIATEGVKKFEKN